LHGKQHHGYQQGQADDGPARGVLQTGHQLEPFHRRENGNGGRYDPVAHQQRNSHIRQHRCQAELSARAQQWPQNGKQHNGAALASLAQAHGKPGIAHGDEQQQRPDDQRENADEMGLRALGKQKDNRQGIYGARADVAKNQPECLDDVLKRYLLCIHAVLHIAAHNNARGHG